MESVVYFGKVLERNGRKEKHGQHAVTDHEVFRLVRDPRRNFASAFLFFSFVAEPDSEPDGTTTCARSSASPDSAPLELMPASAIVGTLEERLMAESESKHGTVRDRVAAARLRFCTCGC